MSEMGQYRYENSSGLVEIAVNRGRASGALAIGVGTPVTIVDSN